jgi:acetolactate synthase-1/2/3 large subunit
VSDVKDVRPRSKRSVAAKGPAFLEVMTDTHGHVYPMVGPGMGYKEMITGKWIPSREVKKTSPRAAGRLRLLLATPSDSG